jgi:hypothetical protein
MPGISWNLLSRLLGNGVIHDKKEYRMGFDPQIMEELGQSDLRDRFHGPDIFSQESGEAAKRSVKKGKTEGLNHGGGVGFFFQLDEADDKGGKEAERRWRVF